MTWTEDKPTAAGWYWMRWTPLSPAQCVWLLHQGYSRDTPLFVRVMGLDRTTPLAEIGGAEWAGPIPEPTN